MKKNYRVLIAALGGAAVLVTAVATTALAASVPNVSFTTTRPAVAVVSTATASPTEADYQAWGCPLAYGNLDAVAGVLGMSVQDIQAQLAQGKSLVDIAATKGISESQLVSAIFAPMKQFIQEQVTAGAWTQQQADARLKVSEQHITQLVNAKGGIGAGGYGCGGACGGPGQGPNAGTASFGRGGMMRGFGGSFGSMMGGWGRS